MQFLRTVFWVVLAVIAVVFAIANQQLVEVHLSGFIWNPPLWFALLVAFLLGLLPTWAFHRATRWNLKRKLEAATRAFVIPEAPATPIPAQPPTP